MSNIISTYELCIEGIRAARIGDSNYSMNLFNEALKLNPTGSAARACLGIRLHAEGLFQDALAHFNAALDTTYSLYICSRVLRCRGLLYQSMEKYDLANSDFNQALEIDPAFYECYYLIGMVQYDLGNFKESVRLMTRMIDYESNNFLALMNRGNAYMMMKEYDLAIQDLTMAIDLNRECSVLYYNRGNVYCFLKNLEAALQDYTTSLELDPTQASTLFNRGNTFHELGRYNEAANDFTMAIKFNPERLLIFKESRGCAYSRLGKRKEALNDFNDIIYKNPDLYSVYYHRSIELFKDGQYKEAILDLQKCISLKPDFKNAHVKLGDFYLKLKRYSKAVKFYTNGLVLDETNTDTLYKRGRCFEYMNLEREAILDFSAVIRIDPNFKRAFIRRARIYATRKGPMTDLAIDDYSSAIELDTEHWSLYLERAKLLLTRCDYFLAVRDCNTVIRHCPDNIDARIIRSSGLQAF